MTSPEPLSVFTLIVIQELKEKESKTAIVIMPAWSTNFLYFLILPVIIFTSYCEFYFIINSLIYFLRRHQKKCLKQLLENLHTGQ